MWHHNKQSSFFEDVFEDSFIGFEKLQYLRQESLICFCSLLLLFSVAGTKCLNFLPSNILPGLH